MLFFLIKFFTELCVTKFCVFCFEGARRKISIVKDTPQTKSPSPPAAIPTSILLIKNLVRPFTLNQIRELLSRTGTIVENGFWMDRIKSKCFVEVRTFSIFKSFYSFFYIKFIRSYKKLNLQS